MVDKPKWEGRLVNKRKGMDHFFKTHPQSPFSQYDQRRFEGLHHFPLDFNLRFELQLQEHPEKREVTVDASHGERREFLRWGEFRFKVGEVDCVLQAYKSDPKDARLFVPFGDLTSGEETYGKGRYLDLEPEIHRLESGLWVLDFNEAHNPWCAYSDAYVCPYAPDENWLEVPVRAGEKRFSLRRGPGDR